MIIADVAINLQVSFQIGKASHGTTHDPMNLREQRKNPHESMAVYPVMFHILHLKQSMHGKGDVTVFRKPTHHGFQVHHSLLNSGRVFLLQCQNITLVEYGQVKLDHFPK